MAITIQDSLKKYFQTYDLIHRKNKFFQTYDLILRKNKRSLKSMT